MPPSSPSQNKLVRQQNNNPGSSNGSTLRSRSTAVPCTSAIKNSLINYDFLPSDTLADFDYLNQSYANSSNSYTLNDNSTPHRPNILVNSHNDSSSNNNGNLTTNNNNSTNNHNNLANDKSDLTNNITNDSNSRSHTRGTSSSSNSLLYMNNSSISRTSYKNKSKPIRPTLITGYNFSNNFVESPTGMHFSAGSSHSASNGNLVTDTPITQINKRIQVFQKNMANSNNSSSNNLNVLNASTNNLDDLNNANSSFSNLLPLASRNITEYRTQPNSFNDSSLDIANLRSTILAGQDEFSKKSSNSGQPLPIPDSLYDAIDDDDLDDEADNSKIMFTKKGHTNFRSRNIHSSHIKAIDAATAQSGPSTNQENIIDEDSFSVGNRSTLLERDFPAEILPFELLDKKDGNYYINSDKVASLYYNDNYGSLRNDIFDDIVNPLEDSRLIRVRTEKKLSTHNNNSQISTDKPESLLKLDNNQTPKPKMRPRTYSESETANFSTVTGERLYDDDKHRPFYSLHANHEKLQDDSIHSTKNNSSISVHNNKKSSKSKSSGSDKLLKEKPEVIQNIYNGLDISSQSDININSENINSSINLNNYQLVSNAEEQPTIPVNITLHGGTIVPDANYKPVFMPRTSYNKSLELSKTHQLATSTMALLNNTNNSRLKLHPNVTIYHNFESLLGCEDEYISGLDFRTSIAQWFLDDRDYNRFYKLQVISSHIHDNSKDDEAKVLETIHSLRHVKHTDGNHDELTAEMPNHDDDPHLSDAPHDYSYKEVIDSDNNSNLERKNLKELNDKKTLSSDTLSDNKYNVIQGSGSELSLLRNQNLKNYSKNILNIHDSDYNNFTGGHSKLNEIPKFISNRQKTANSDKNDRLKKVSPTRLDRPFESNMRNTALRIRLPRESPKKAYSQEQPRKSLRKDMNTGIIAGSTKNHTKGLAIGNADASPLPSVKVSTTEIISKPLSHHRDDDNGYANLEHGTVVVDNSLSSSTSSSANSSPLMLNELKRKLSSLVLPINESNGKVRNIPTIFESKIEEVKQNKLEEVFKPKIEKVVMEPDTVKEPGIGEKPVPNNKAEAGATVDYDEIISKLPENFVQLSFSKRRNILLELVPKNTKLLDSKLLLQKIKQRFSKSAQQAVAFDKKANQPSAAALFLSRTTKAAAKAAPTAKQNIDVKGSIVMNHELGKIIGYGSWGIVRECFSLNPEDHIDNENRSDGSHRLIRAIKIVKTKNELVRKCFQKEIRIWKLLNHKRLLPLLFVKETSYAIFCITPRIYGGTLFDIVSNWGEYNDPNSPIVISKRLLLIRKFAFEILDGLSYMHYNGIVHGDLKLENCLIDEIRNPMTKRVENHILVCDFGMSTFYIDPERTKNNLTSSARASYTMLNERNHVKSANKNTDENHPDRPLIPRSSSSDFLANKHTRLQKIVFDKSKTHDDTPMHISQRQYGPAPTSTSLNIMPIVFNYIQNDQPSNDKTPMPHTHIGSLPYASPEILLPNPPPLGPTADIWAFGVLLYTMIVGRLPFKHNFEPRLTAIIARGKYEVQSLQNAGGSDPALVEIVNGCLTKDITLRWDLEKIVETLLKPTI